MFSNIMQTVAIVGCIGGILLVLLVAWIARKAFGSRSQPQNQYDPNNQSSVLRQQGSERPRYDDDQIESSGGFGNAPTMGSRPKNNQGGMFGGSVSRDRNRDLNRSRDRDRSSDPLDQPQRNRNDDEDVSSRGGFGGG